MASRTQAIRNWQRRMGYTQGRSAEALGICKSAFKYYAAGKRREKKEDEFMKVEIPKTVLLACAAVEAGLSPIR